VGTGDRSCYVELRLRWKHSRVGMIREERFFWTPLFGVEKRFRFRPLFGFSSCLRGMSRSFATKITKSNFGAREGENRSCVRMIKQPCVRMIFSPNTFCALWWLGHDFQFSTSPSKRSQIYNVNRLRRERKLTRLGHRDRLSTLKSRNLHIWFSYENRNRGFLQKSSSRFPLSCLSSAPRKDDHTVRLECTTLNEIRQFGKTKTKKRSREYLLNITMQRSASSFPKCEVRR